MEKRLSIEYIWSVECTHTHTHTHTHKYTFWFISQRGTAGPLGLRYSLHMSTCKCNAPRCLSLSLSLTHTHTHTLSHILLTAQRPLSWTERKSRLWPTYTHLFCSPTLSLDFSSFRSYWSNYFHLKGTYYAKITFIRCLNTVVCHGAHSRERRGTRRRGLTSK